MIEPSAPAAVARADLCRFLAACYYEPGTEFTQERLFDSLREAARRADPGLEAQALRVGEAFRASPLDELLLDYARLFLGPSGALAPPYGSVWLEGQEILMRDSTVAVSRLYEEGGFEIAEDFRELPDHIAVELEFLYLLLFREEEAKGQADAAQIERMAGLKRRFLDEHLGRWVGPFATAVRSAAETRFYREVANLTERVVLMERQR